MQIKLDEIIRAIDTAHYALLDFEQLIRKNSLIFGSITRDLQKKRAATCGCRAAAQKSWTVSSTKPSARKDAVPRAKRASTMHH